MFLDILVVSAMIIFIIIIVAFVSILLVETQSEKFISFDNFIRASLFWSIFTIIFLVCLIDKNKDENIQELPKNKIHEIISEDDEVKILKIESDGEFYKILKFKDGKTLLLQNKGKVNEENDFK